jgi:hypothetical protein
LLVSGAQLRRLLLVLGLLSVPLGAGAQSSNLTPPSFITPGATVGQLFMNGIAATSTDGLTLANMTAATAGVPVQQSPRLRFRSNVWNSTATAATNTNDWWIESVPVNGASPTGLLKFGSALNGAGATYPFTFASSGNFVASAVLGVSTLTLGINGATGTWVLGVDGGLRSASAGYPLGFGAAGTLLTGPVNGQLNITNAAASAGVGIDVTTDSIAAFRNRAQNADGGVRAAYYNSSASSVLSVASNVIAPTGSIHHVGAGLIKTITVPALCTPTCAITIIPDAAYTYDATDNVVVPGGGGTATINRAMTFTFDGAKWIPSY